MASYDVNKINVSLLKQYKTFFDNENSYYNTASYNTFLSSYLNNCSDPFIQNMSTILKRDYEQIKKGYNSINNWWSSYNSGVEALEEKLATCIFQSVIDETINNLDSLSLMEYSSFYDGLLSAYNDIFINNIGSPDFSLDKLRTLSEENIIVKNFITLYPNISDIDPIEARSIVNSLVNDNITDEQVVSKVSSIITSLVKNGEIDKIEDLIRFSQERDTVIIFNFRDSIVRYPKYKNELETICQDYKEYQDSKYQEIINEIALKKDIETFNEYKYFISFNYNELTDYLMKNGEAQKAFKVLDMLGVDIKDDSVDFDGVLKSFVDNYTSQEMIDLFTSLKASGNVFLLDIKKVLEMVKGKDNYDLLKNSLYDYYNYQTTVYKEQVLEKLHPDSLDFPIPVTELIALLKKRAGIELDIDYSKEIVNMFLNGQEKQAVDFARLFIYDESQFNEKTFLDYMLRDGDTSNLVHFFELAKEYRVNIITLGESITYLENLKQQDYDLYLKVNDIFNNHFSNYSKETSNPEAYAFLKKVLQESDNPALNYLANNLYLLNDYHSPFSITINQGTPCFYFPTNLLSIPKNTLMNEEIGTIFHELGHCLFYVFAKGDFPMDYINDPTKYYDRLLVYENGTYSLNSDARNFVNDVCKIDNEGLQKRFISQYDAAAVRTEITKEISEKINSIDMSEIDLLLEETIDYSKKNFVMAINDIPLEEMEDISEEKLDLLLANISKEDIIEFIVDNKCKIAELDAYIDYSSKDIKKEIASFSLDIIRSVLRGEDYGYERQRIQIKSRIDHSASYYASDNYASFNEQIADFTALKFFKADEEIEKLRKLLGDDWYNMMNDAYNKSMSKLEEN